MNNISKLLMVTLMVVSAALIVELADNPAGKNETGGRDSIMGRSSVDAFVNESNKYEDRFLFTYSPKNPDSRFDCYMSYDFRENGNVLENIDKEFYGNVSAENPIVLEFPRKKDSIYELEVKIKDKSGVNLHESKIEISPATVENETSN